MSIVVHPLTAERWADVEDLFGPQGAIMGCWCMYWRLPRKDWEAARGKDAKALFRKRVKAGPPPGVLAYDGEKAVGWMQIGPRNDAPQWNTPKRLSAPLKEGDAEDARVWGASCFFVRRGFRGKGVMSALVKGGVAFAKKNGAKVVEACPADAGEKADPGALYVGVSTVFERAGFKEIARRKASRPLMRLKLRP